MVDQASYSRAEYNAAMNSYMKERWRKRRAAAVTQLGGECVECGATEELEFDHIDPSTKVSTIAQLSSASEVRFQAELAKCQLLCKEHHLEKSRREGSLKISGKRKRKQPVCGESSGYNRAKCRCEKCRAWKSASRKRPAGV